MGVRLLEMRRKGLLSSGGKIVYWNQLLPNFSSTYYSSAGSAGSVSPSITYHNNTVTISYPQDQSGSSPRTYNLRSASLSLLYNNKYYFSVQIKTNTTQRWSIYKQSYNNSDIYNSSQWTTYKTIYTSTTQNDRLYYILQPQGIPLVANTYWSLQIPIVINLTEMFGAGNEPNLATFQQQCTNNGIDLSVYQEQAESKGIFWK